MGSIVAAVVGRGKVWGLGSAGCQPASLGSLPRLFGVFQFEEGTTWLLPASCRQLQASSLRSPDRVSRPGVKFAVHRFQSLLIDMCINLCRRNIGMAEHLLNDAQVCAVPQ